MITTRASLGRVSTFDADGVRTVFSFDTLAVEQGDLVVETRTAPAAPWERRVANVDYTVSAFVEGVSGTIAFMQAPPRDAQVRIRSTVGVGQPFNLEALGGYDAATVEDALDRLSRVDAAILDQIPALDLDTITQQVKTLTQAGTTRDERINALQLLVTTLQAAVNALQTGDFNLQLATETQPGVVELATLQEVRSDTTNKVPDAKTVNDYVQETVNAALGGETSLNVKSIDSPNPSIPTNTHTLVWVAALNFDAAYEVYLAWPPAVTTVLNTVPLFLLGTTPLAFNETAAVGRRSGTFTSFRLHAPTTDTTKQFLRNDFLTITRDRATRQLQWVKYTGPRPWLHAVAYVNGDDDRANGNYRVVVFDTFRALVETGATPTVGTVAQFNVSAEGALNVSLEGLGIFATKSVVPPNTALTGSLDVTLAGITRDVYPQFAPASAIFTAPNLTV